MYKDNIAMVRDVVPDFEEKIFSVLGCSLEKLTRDCNKKKGFPQHIIRQIAALPSARKEHVLIDKLTKWTMSKLTLFVNHTIFPLLEDRAIQSMESYIFKSLYSLCFRTHTYDYNKAKLAAPNLTVEEYENSFYDADALEAFFQRYPALADLIINYKSNIVAFTNKIIIAYHRDVREIKSAMGLQNEVITKITMGLGDSHNNGQTVTMLHLKNERVLYKPSDGRINDFYARFAAHFSDDTGIAIVTPKILLRDDWHWCEFIQHRPCAGRDDLAQFYLSIGAQLMLIYSVNGQDLHYENLIAVGKYPVLIDLECLFSNGQKTGACDFVIDSVLSTGMLPALQANPMSKYVAALSTVDNQKTAYRLLVEQDEDGFSVVRQKDIAVKALSNIPTYGGRRVTAQAFSEHIIQGFQLAWHYVAAHKQTILQLLNHYPSGIKVRKIYQGTQTYSRLLSMSYHPRFLQDKTSRALYLLSVLGSNEESHIARKSYTALLQGDIPSHTLTLRIAGAANNSQTQQLLDNLARRLDRLNDEDRHFQSDLIRLAIASLGEPKKLPRKTPPASLQKNIDLAAIESLFARVLNTQHRARYFNYRRDFGSFTQMQDSLYSGTGGLAFVSLCLYIATRNRHYIDTAVTLIENRCTPGESGFGAMVGYASTAYLLELIYTLTGEEHYFAQAVDALCSNLEYADDEEPVHDFLKGHAGCLVIALNLLRHDRQNTRLLSVVDAHMQAIIAGSQYAADDKVTWDRGLTGFTHGNAGIIYALAVYLEQSDAAEKDKVSTLIAHAINYENVFKNSSGWKDLREEGVQKNDSMIWCNGAPGIALSRQKVQALGLYPVEDDLQLAKKLLAKQKKEPRTFALCHSTMSNLIISGRVSGEAPTRELREVLETILQRLTDDAELQAISQHSQDISLMTGVCGVLYAWLWLHYPVPFVLTLAPCPAE